MSRSWERKVRKNSSVLNKKLQKHGKPAIQVGQEQYDEYRGRNFILPSVLIILALMYAVIGSMFWSKEQSTLMYWVTVIAYIGLGVVLFAKRPFLKVGRDNIMTTKWNRVRVLYAKDIKKITIQPGYVVIEQSKRGANWVFSRVMNRYDTELMGARLTKFANQHQIELEQLSK
ncbi:hypothetical protein [Paenibacillus taiwanensis]|uniref:hypothetical protein n=1 Tax=Paenibacillus taiwanensis TaxID=401638 RepID=UPI000419A04D|nr:hypothetical protein [Paenibacillus taiwanensis]